MSNTKQTVNKAWQECLDEARKELPNMAGIITSEQAQLAAEKYAVMFGNWAKPIGEYAYVEQMHKRFIEENKYK